MNDLRLDASGDLLIANMDALIVQGADRVRQQLYVRLNLWVSEWFLDTEFGTPYIDGILGKQISLNGAIATLKQAILGVPDVDRINELKYSFDRSTRRLTVNFECHTPYGLIRATNT